MYCSGATAGWRGAVGHWVHGCRAWDRDRNWKSAGQSWEGGMAWGEGAEEREQRTGHGAVVSVAAFVRVEPSLAPGPHHHQDAVGQNSSPQARFLEPPGSGCLLGSQCQLHDSTLFPCRTGRGLPSWTTFTMSSMRAHRPCWDWAQKRTSLRMGAMGDSWSLLRYGHKSG